MSDAPQNTMQSDKTMQLKPTTTSSAHNLQMRAVLKNRIDAIINDVTMSPGDAVAAIVALGEHFKNYSVDKEFAELYVDWALENVRTRPAMDETTENPNLKSDLEISNRIIPSREFLQIDL